MGDRLHPGRADRPRWPTRERMAGGGQGRLLLDPDRAAYRKHSARTPLRPQRGTRAESCRQYGSVGRWPEPRSTGSRRRAGRRVGPVRLAGRPRWAQPRTADRDARRSSSSSTSTDSAAASSISATAFSNDAGHRALAHPPRSSAAGGSLRATNSLRRCPQITVWSSSERAWPAPRRRRAPADGFDGRVVLVGDEPTPPYERPPLSKAVLRGEAAPETTRVHDEDFYESNDIELLTGRTVEALDRAGHEVRLGGGESHPVHHRRAGHRRRSSPSRPPGVDARRSALPPHYRRLQPARRGDPRRRPSGGDRRRLDRIGGRCIGAPAGRRRRPHRPAAGAAATRPRRRDRCRVRPAARRPWRATADGDRRRRSYAAALPSNRSC